MFDWYDLRNFLEDNLIVSIFVGIAFAIAIVWTVVVFVQARGGGFKAVSASLFATIVSLFYLVMAFALGSFAEPLVIMPYFAVLAALKSMAVAWRVGAR
mgnify:FL=1